MKDGKQLRVLVIDDSAFARQTISSILNGMEGVEVVGKASDGADAIPKILKLEPDLITCDLEMPNMDGYELLRWLMATRPTPTIVVSSLSGQEDVFRALELGALDFVRKPQRSASPELASIQADVERVISELPYLRLQPRKGRPVMRPPRLPAPADRPAASVRSAAPSPTSKPLRIGDAPPAVVVIGASTGGPAAVEKILRPLPEGYPSPILVVQHMPPGFTRLFADRLDRLCRIRVVESETGQKLEPGTAYVCAGGHHTLVEHTGTVATLAAHPSDRYVPSVDRTMRSVAEHYAGTALGILLTGMGDDGKLGMGALDKSQGMTVAESEETALVYGMPERAIAAGVVDLVLSLNEIQDLLLGLGARSSTRRRP